jgi:hypothetical protein
MTHISLLTSNDSFKIIQTRKDGVVVRITVEITARVDIEFNYFANANHARKIGESNESAATKFRAALSLAYKEMPPMTAR